MSMRGRILMAVVIAAAAAVAVSAQQQEPPVFRSSVEVTAFDVTVLDDRGRPVVDLTTDDFSVRIDGTPRRLVSAQWIPLETSRTAASAAPLPEGYSANNGRTAGRLIMIVVDQPNIRFGGTLAIQRAVNEFIDRLEPTDRAAIVGIGLGATSTPFTADRDRLKKALGRLTGLYQPPMMHLHTVTLSEAMEIVNTNALTMELVTVRECRDFKGGMLTGLELENCQFELSREASDIAREGTADGRQTMSALRLLLTALRGIDVPKTLILVTEGFIIDNQQPEVIELGALAAAARTSIYGLKLDDQLFTSLASQSRAPMVRMADRQARSAGLELLTATSRGSLMNIIGSGQGVFERITSELGGYYLLGVEAGAADKDGKSHPLKVEVARKGLTVRARSALFGPPAPAAPATPRQAVLAALSAPLQETALPLRVSTYSLQGPESDKVQVLLHADIGADYPQSRIVALGYVVSDLDGKVVESQAASARLPPIMTGVPSALQFTTGASLAPGDYLLKLAVAEGDKVGTVEHSFHAGVEKKGELGYSDLMVGGPANIGLELTQPTIGYTVVFGGVHGYVEAYGRDARRLKAKYEIAADPAGPAILSEEVAPTIAGSGGSRAIFSKTMRVRQLPPGRYVLRVALSGAPDARTFVRAFEVAPPAVLMTSAADSATGALPSDVYLPVAETLLSPSFDRLQAARPAVVDAFHPHVSQSLRGGFDEGVQFLSEGAYDKAETAFKAAVSPEADSAGALAYLAATYAAAGFDLQAANAWQTALVDGSDVPQIYQWLVDALFRLRDIAQARGAIEEAIAKWPADTRFAQSLAIVYATLGEGPQAVRSLERYLADHPGDSQMALTMVEWIYQLHLAGATAGTRAADIQLARKYADVYVKTGGPQVALVRQWIEYLEKGVRR